MKYLFFAFVYGLPFYTSIKKRDCSRHPAGAFVRLTLRRQSIDRGSDLHLSDSTGMCAHAPENR